MSADRPLRTEADHATALAEIRRLWNSPVGTPEGDQLDLLLVLVDAYEEGEGMKRLMLSGPFSDDDLAEIAELMRRMDARNPSAIFTMTMVDDDASLDEAEVKLRRMLPLLPDRATAFARAAYRDDNFPERLCDHCHKPYRGPAVYCSLDCAVADA